MADVFTAHAADSADGLWSLNEMHLRQPFSLFFGRNVVVGRSWTRAVCLSIQGRRNAIRRIFDVLRLFRGIRSFLVCEAS
jgi:hypothetical protein